MAYQKLRFGKTEAYIQMEKCPKYKGKLLLRYRKSCTDISTQTRKLKAFISLALHTLYRILRTVHNSIQPCLFYNQANWSHYMKPQYQYASYATGMTNERKTNGFRRVFSAWRPLRIGAGIILVVAAFKWRQSYTRAGRELHVAKKWEVTCYRMIPLRASSRAWGWLTNIELPRPIRPLVYRFYSGMFGVDLDEARECDLTCFPTLADFFCRELKDGVRPIDPAPIVSPADGSVLNFGMVDASHVDQVKGIKYSIPSFLGQPSWLQKGVVYGETVEADSEMLLPSGTTDSDWEQYKRSILHKPDSELYQCVVYLAPGDYHRFHSPVSWTVQFRRHFQGDLLSVNPKIARWIPDLFALNERAVYVGKWQHGFFGFVAVAATNVGNIRVHCDETLHTNKPKRRGQPMHIDRYLCPEKGGIPIAKGEHFGEFRLGSTVVLLFEAPKDFDFTLKRGQKIKMGEALSWLHNGETRHPVPPA